MNTRYFRILLSGLQSGEVWKQASEAFDVKFDWSRVLGNDRIASSSWALPEDWTQPQAASVDTATETIAKVWVGGGQPGTMSVLVNTITTDGGRTFQAYCICHVREDAA